MPKLTGYQRFQIAKVWLARHRDTDKETYIKKVCKAKNIEYVPPVERKRDARKATANHLQQR